MWKKTSRILETNTILRHIRSWRLHPNNDGKIYPWNREESEEWSEYRLRKDRGPNGWQDVGRGQVKIMWEWRRRRRYQAPDPGKNREWPHWVHARRGSIPLPPPAHQEQEALSFFCITYRAYLLLTYALEAFATPLELVEELTGRRSCNPWALLSWRLLVNPREGATCDRRESVWTGTTPLEPKMILRISSIPVLSNLSEYP